MELICLFEKFTFQASRFGLLAILYYLHLIENMKNISFILLLIMLISVNACKTAKQSKHTTQQDANPSPAVVQTVAITEKEVVIKIYKQASNHEIAVCKLENNTYYTASHNVPDGSMSVYDMQGNKIATCGGLMPAKEKICTDLTGCVSVYIPIKNIWGKKPVDKYGIGLN